MPDDELTPRETLQWYFDQANAGEPLAMRELGRMYLHGFTHDEDPDVEILPDGDQADRWLSESIDAGDDEAAWLLGILHDGEAIEEDVG